MKSSDDHAEAVRRTAKWIMIASALTIFGSFFLGAILGPVAFVLAGLAIVLFVFFWIRHASHGHADVEDRKLEVVSTLLENLAPELHPKRRVAVKVDFRAHSKLKPARKESLGWGQKSIAYVHPWLELHFVLRDGTSVSVQVTTHEKRKTKAKRKYTKIKGRAHETIAIQYRFPDKSEPPAAMYRSQARQTVGNRQGQELIRNGRKGIARLTGPRGTFLRGRYQTTNTTQGIDGSWLTKALVQTYRHLKQAA